MNSNISLFILLLTVLNNIYFIANTDAPNFTFPTLSFIKIKSAIGSASGTSSTPTSGQVASTSTSTSTSGQAASTSTSGQAASTSAISSTSSSPLTPPSTAPTSSSSPRSPNERKRKLATDERDSGSPEHRSVRRLRVEECEASSCQFSLEFISESLKESSLFEKPNVITEEQLLELIITEFENKGINRDQIREEDIFLFAASQAKKCFKKWKKVKQSLKLIEASLVDLEERQRQNTNYDEDELRYYSDTYEDLTHKQDLFCQIESSLACNYNHYLSIKQKFSRVRRSSRLSTTRHSAASQSTSQTPSTSSQPLSLQSQSALAQQSTSHVTTRSHHRTSQSGRNTTSTRSGTRRKRYRRRRRTF